METRKLTIADVEFDVAPTPIVKLAGALELVGNKETRFTEEGQRALIAAVFWGARRAKAQITLEWLEDNVDIHNVGDVFRVFVALNKVQVKEPTGTESAPGEAQSAASS
jgi:hypothetical protein